MYNIIVKSQQSQGSNNKIHKINVGIIEYNIQQGNSIRQDFIKKANLNERKLKQNRIITTRFKPLDGVELEET